MPSQSSSQLPQQLRLNKFLAERLGISRREADDLIADGKVYVDNSVAILGTRITPESNVRLGDEQIKFNNQYVYIMIYLKICVLMFIQF